MKRVESEGRALDMSDERDRGGAVAKAVSISDKLIEWERLRGIRVGHRVATYVSVPITSGLTFMEWFHRQGRHLTPGSEAYTTAHRAYVILPNVQHAASFIELLRWDSSGFIIDPTALDVPGWTQAEYNEFWCEVIERHVRRVVFLDGWHHSQGCTLEFEAAQEHSLECVDERFEPISRETGLALLSSAIEERRQAGLDPAHLEGVARRLRSDVRPIITANRLLYKDEVLNRLAETANVAQFVSFAPGDKLDQRYCRIAGLTPNHRFSSVRDAVENLLSRSPEGMVNIRTFDPRKPEGNPFERKLRSVDDVLARLRILGVDQRLHTIVNETINESDGGVSGVAYRGLVEFAPDTTPRCVDDVSVATTTLPLEMGIQLLRTVYGTEPDLRGREGSRVEFSIHPAPRGWMHDHTIIWQLEQRPSSDLAVAIHWPTAFSRMLGDKAFGLALASSAGLRVPRTFVFSRRLLPFVFGEPTGTREYWTRTCPEEKTPGYYPTVKGWRDPYSVLRDWRSLVEPVVSEPAPNIPPLASVLVQEGVAARYSGRVVQRTEGVIVAGVAGEGDRFMLGTAEPNALPSTVISAVRDAHSEAQDVLGPVDLEWVFDGNAVWIVQVNNSGPAVRRAIDESAAHWVQFRYQNGRLEEFRGLVASLRGTKAGVIVIGNVSPLSHVGEIAELAGVPARFMQDV